MSDHLIGGERLLRFRFSFRVKHMVPDVLLQEPNQVPCPVLQRCMSTYLATYISLANLIV